jgi:hypothetical protein
MFSKISLTSISWLPLTILTVLLITIMTLLLFVSQSYFNSSEINLLVEKAEENDLEYELVIHNQFTNSYSFLVPAKTSE